MRTAAPDRSSRPRSRDADPRFLLSAVVLLAIACRLAGAGHRLVLDEGYSWLVASAPTFHAFLDRLAAFENTPPLFYALLSPLPLDSEAWVRLPALAAGAATVPLLYAIVSPLSGSPAGLLAALALAVAPYQVATAGLARGFTLATFGLLLAVWASVRLSLDRSRRWWWVYAAGVVIAIWSEYYAVLTVIALLIALLALRVRPHREVLLLGAVPLATMLPWAWQLKRSLDLDGLTKVLPRGRGIAPGVIRDEIVPLFFGEHGELATLRGLELVLLLILIAAAAWLVRGDRRLLWLTGGVAGGTLLAHAAAAQAGPGLFERRYLSVLVPLALGLLASALAALKVRRLVLVSAVALGLLGIGVIVKRAGSDAEPDYGSVARAASAAATVLTNSPVVDYYLRARHAVALDRPFGLGPGLEQGTPAPYAVVDDTQVGSGARQGPGALTRLGRITVRVVAARLRAASIPAARARHPAAPHTSGGGHLPA